MRTANPRGVKKPITWSVNGFVDRVSTKIVKGSERSKNIVTGSRSDMMTVHGVEIVMGGCSAAYHFTAE